MQSPILRSSLAVVASIVIAIGLFMAIEGLSAVLHPWPDDFAGSPEEIAAQVKSYPVWVLALLGGVGYGLTMLLCTFLATRIGYKRSPRHGYAVGAFLFALIVLNLLMLPYPVWYWILMFTVLPLAAFFGTKLAMHSDGP